MSRLLIVESPTKARTIKKILGASYTVLSSYGHIRDLPKKDMGVDIENDFAPTYVVADDKKAKVADLKKAAKAADEIFLATDGDREGEAIAWHIANVLKLDPKTVKRITFHEITKAAIEKALEKPSSLGMHLVEAQQARRILDRLVGYELSPFLWQKVRRGLSAGRVQSVATRLIVERERERQAFNVDEYWSVHGSFEKDGESFEGKLNAIQGKKLKKLDIKDEAAATAILNAVKDATFSVSSVEKKKAKKQPPKPLTTSLLQQEANNKLGFGAKRTMTLAQKLYETGKITYMRTDSMALADSFLQEAQAFISGAYGPDYAQGPATYKTKSKGAQEAHEAIRPTDPALTPDKLETKDAGVRKLYELIWSRTLASQMPAAELERTGINLEANEHTFRASGSIIVFDGFMKVYRSAKETILPELTEGDTVNATSIEPKQHFTEPPARYSDATLVKIMEEHGIGRPSTYAPTISTIINRGYVERDDNKKLAPTEIAMIVSDLLVEHFPDIVDYEFTAHMEEKLDNVAHGKQDWVPALKEFYTPFHKNLEVKTKELTRDDVMKDRELGKDPDSGLTVYLKVGRFGPFIQVGEWSEEDKKAKKNKPKSVSLLKGMNFETVTLEEILPLLELPRQLGTTEAGEPVTAQIGPYGPYLKAGRKNASIPEEFDIMTMTEADAKKIIKEDAKRREEMKKPIQELGKDPTTEGNLLVKNGRFGPYITDGTTNVSVPKKYDPNTITREEAIELLIKKRARPQRKRKK